MTMGITVVRVDLRFKLEVVGDEVSAVGLALDDDDDDGATRMLVSGIIASFSTFEHDE